MEYITGIHALNLDCDLETCGDWHTSALQWKNPNKKQSEKSIFGDYGIMANKNIPEHQETFYVANHIRALLDLLDEGRFTVAQGMRDNYIVTDKYNKEIFSKVLMLKPNKNWKDIDAFMCREYMKEWISFKKGS